MTNKFGDEYWTTLDCGGVDIGLYWTEGGEVPNFPKDSHGSRVGATLTLQSDDILFDKTALESAGAKILGQADRPWEESQCLKISMATS